MDETASGELRAARPEPCVFEKAMLARCCRCALAVPRAIAERETLGCRSAVAREQCRVLLEALRENALFALKLARDAEPLPHAKLLRLQCGGLAGVQQAVTGGERIDDVHTLLLDARDKFGGIDRLPYSRIMQAVAAFRLRRRSES